MTSRDGPTDRLFTESGAERRDDLGFLDVSRTRAFWLEDLLAESVAWVLGPPWIGKTTVAIKTDAWLSLTRGGIGGTNGQRPFARQTHDCFLPFDADDFIDCGPMDHQDGCC